MQNYSLTLREVYSCPAAALPAGITLPLGWSLMWHQAETANALSDPNIDVVINTAMTGDGKSLAAYIRPVLGQDRVLGLYPTNELARDQWRQINHYIEQFQPDLAPRLHRLSGPDLELLAEQEGLRKGDAIASRIGNSEILLTNPDLLHYLHQGAYLVPQRENPDKLWGRIDQDFNTFIFDEFHVFQPPQIASVLNTMLLIRATKRRKKFLFLSATPDEQLLEKLHRADFRYRVIDPHQEGKYAFPETAAEVAQLREAGWRQVVRSLDLHFIPLASKPQASELWLKEQGEQILQTFLDRPHSKGAIILNAIATVKRLVPFFQNLFAPHGLTVGENTGLSGQQTKQASLEADLVIGTSTIDVGVDFQINLLWFESADAGNFIQRLGRLGRHGENAQGQGFEGFTAWAFVPQFWVERLFAGENPPLEPGMVCDRPAFHEVIRTTYQQINNFEGYYRDWAILQSLSLCLDLNRKEIKASYGEASDRLKTETQQVFDASLGQAVARVQHWRGEWQAFPGATKGNPIAEEANAFRGSSPLLCGLMDETEATAADRFKTYDLPGILGNLEVEFWSKGGLLVELRQTMEQTGAKIAKGRFNHCFAFFKLKGYRSERLPWHFTYGGTLAERVDLWRVQILTGVGVWQPDSPWVRQLGRALSAQALVCYLLPCSVWEARQRLRLPMHFAIYPISDRTSLHATTPPYAIAIGQAALLLASLNPKGRFERKGGET